MPATASGGNVYTYGAAAGASSLSTTIQAAASPSTKGTAVELTAATDIEARWVMVTLNNPSAAVGYWVDILAGAATEAVIIPDVLCYARIGGGMGPYLFPITIARGTRLSARCQSETASATVQVAITLIGAGPADSGAARPAGYVSGYGSGVASLGTNVENTVLDTDGAWVQMTAATERDHHWLSLSARFGDLALASQMNWRIAIGIGAATESVLIPDIHVSAEQNADLPGFSVLNFPCFIPRGSRLTMRVRSNTTTNGDRDIFARLYGSG